MFTTISFLFMEGNEYELMQCDVCGALVINTLGSSYKHEQYHKARGEDEPTSNNGQAPLGS